MCKTIVDVEEVKQPDGFSLNSDANCQIKLKGSWLDDLGFKVGDKVAVRASRGRIEIVANWVDEYGLISEEERR